MRNWNLSLVLFTSVSAACAHTPQPPPARPCTLPIRIDLVAGSRINLDPHGKPLPTVVRVYQTSDSIRLEEADFHAVWEQPEETLGDHLFEVQQFTVFPGTSQTVDVSLSPETRYLFGVAIFRRPTGRQWRAMLALPPSARLCAEYERAGAPDPAIVLDFDMYRVEATSHLLRPVGDVEMPLDVAPDQPAPDPPPSRRSRFDVQSASSAPTAPDAPAAGAPNAPEAPTVPEASRSPF